MAILWAFGELVMTCIDAAYFLLLPALQLQSQQWVKKKHVMFYGILSIIVISAHNYYTVNNISILLFSITLFLIYSIFFIQGSFLFKLFWVVFPLSLLHGSELAAFYTLMNMYPEITMDVFSLQNIYRLQMIFIAKSLQVLLFVFFLHFKLELKHSKYVVLPLTVVSILSIAFSLTGELIGFTDFNGLTAQTLLFLFAIAFLFINFCYFCYLLYTGYNNKQHEKFLQQQLEQQQAKLQQQLELKLQAQQLELKLKSHEELAAAHQKFKQFQAEVKENLQSLWSLAKTHKIPQFEKYLTQVSQINQQFSKIYQTGDAVLDAVLSSKEALANLQHIQMQAKISLPPPNIFNSLDLGTILINLLDNAIEAQHTLASSTDIERIIGLTMEIKDNYYKIEVHNPSDTQEQYSQDELITLSSRQNSGLGLKIIKELVDKYAGTVQIVHKNHRFTVLIYLPLYQNPT